MASPAAVLSILVRANTGGATTGILRVNQSLTATDKAAARTDRNTSRAFSSMARGADKAAAAFEGVFKVMAIGGAVGAAAGLAFSVKKAAEFEQQLSSLGSVAEANGRQMDRFRKQALKAGADTKFSALEAAQAQTELAKGGLTVQQIMKGGLRSSLALAAAGEMELADAATATVNAMKLFGLRGKDSMKVADAFATAANRTTADVSDFAMALSQGGSAAKAAGLSFNETVAYLEALAEAGIKNSDAGTSMKTALLQIASPTEKAANLMQDLGLKFFDAHGNMKSLVDISGMLREKMGGLTREQRVQATSTLAGTDGMRGLLALYDAGPKKIAGFEKGLNKQGSAAEVAKRKQDNLAGSLEQLGGSVETVGIQIGSALLPYLRRASDEATTFVNKVGRIVSRDDLSLGEKLQKAFDLAKVTVDPWIDKLKAAIERADIPRRLADVVSTATPMILKGFAMGGVAAAKTFAGAFADADAWGKLALGSFLIRRLGLGGLLTRGLKGAGGAGALGQAANATKPVPVFVVNNGVPGGRGGPVPVPGGGGAVGRVKGLLKGAGRLGAGLAALDVGINLVDSRGNPIAATINTAHDLTFGIIPKVHVTSGTDRINEQIRDATKKLDELTKTRDISGLAGITTKLRGMADEARDFGRADLGKQWDRLADKAGSTATKLQQSQEKVAGMSDRFAAAIRGLRVKSNDDFDKLVHNVVNGSKRIRDVGGLNAKQTREAISKQFRIARDRVREAMHDKIISVKEGTERLHDLAVKELGLYGIKAGRVNVVLAGTKSGNAGQMRPHQRGGHITGGAPTGDSIPALLERDEYVLNRRAVSKVGKHNLDRLNFAAAPRFQKGGMVDPAWDPGNERLASGISGKVGAWAKRFQANMTAGYDPGGGHVSPGHNITGTATDMVPLAGDWDLLEKGLRVLVNAGMKVLYGSNGVGTPWPNHGRGNHAHIEWGAGGGALPSLFDGLARVALQGPPSVALEAGQAMLDRVRGAADASISRALASTAEGHEAGSNFAGGGAFNKASLRRLWRQANGRLGNANLMAAIALAESGGNPSAHNPSGASGLWQILGLPFPGDPFNPLTNARMAGAKLRSQGLGAWEAYTNGNYQQFLRKGGMVAGAGAGDRVPAMLEPGEFVIRKQIVDKLGPTFFADLNGMQRGGTVKHPISAAHKKARKAFGKSQSRATRQQAKALRAAERARGRGRTPRKPWDQNLQGFIDLFQSQLAVAELTESTADDLEALQTLQAFYESGLRGAQRRHDTEKVTEYAQGLAGIRGQIKDLGDTGEDPNQSLIDAISENTEAVKAHDEALRGVKDELKRQTDLATQISSSSGFQQAKFVADVLSGQMGRGIVDRSRTPGSTSGRVAVNY